MKSSIKDYLLSHEPLPLTKFDSFAKYFRKDTEIDALNLYLSFLKSQKNKKFNEKFDNFETQSLHKSLIKSLAFSPNSKFIAFGHEDGLIKLLNLNMRAVEVTFKGHKGGVNSLNFRTDGKFLASASDDCLIILWNVDLKRKEAILKGHKNPISCLSFNTDGSTLVSSSVEGSIKIWNLLTRSEKSTISAHRDLLSSICFSPNNKFIISASADSTIKVWNSHDMTEDSCLKGHKESVESICFSPDGKWLISCSCDESVKLWNFSTRSLEYTFKGHTNYVNSISVSIDNKYIASGSDDGLVKIWNIQERREEASFKAHSDSVTFVQFSPDGNLLASASEDETFAIFYMNSKAPASCIGLEEQVKSISFSPDGKYLAGAGSCIKIWDVKHKRETASFKKCRSGVSSFSFSPCGRYLASASEDLEVWNLAKKKEEVVLERHGSDDEDRPRGEDKVSFKTEFVRLDSLRSKESEKLSSGRREESADYEKKANEIPDFFEEDEEYENDYSNEGEKQDFDQALDEFLENQYEESPDIIDIDQHTRTLIENDLNYPTVITNPLNSEFGLLSQCQAATWVCFTPDLKYLASVSNTETIKFWSFQQKRLEFTIQSPGDSIKQICFSSNGLFLASISDSHTVLMWDFPDRSQLCPLLGHSSTVLSINFSNDNRFLASGAEDFTIKIWNCQHMREEMSLYGHTGGVNSVYFSHDCRFLASGADDSLVKIWNLEEKREETTLKAHNSKVNSVCFSNTGKYLASASADKTIKIWNMICIRKKIIKTSPMIVTLSPNGKVFGCKSQESYTFYSVSDKPKIVPIPSFPAGERDFYFGEDSSVVAYKKTSDTLRVFDIETGEDKAINYTPEEARNLVTFDPLALYSHIFSDFAQSVTIVNALESDDFRFIGLSHFDTFIGSHNFTIFHFLAYLGQVDVIERNMEKSVLPIFADYFGRSPIYYAAKQKHWKIIDLIVNNLIRIAKTGDKSSWISNFWAIRNDFVIIIENSSYILESFLHYSLINLSSQTKFASTSSYCTFQHCFKPSFSDFITDQSFRPKPLQLKSSIFKLPCKLGSKKCYSLLTSILNSSDTSIYNALLVTSFIDSKWAEIKTLAYIHSFIIWVNMLAIPIIASRTEKYLDEIFCGVFLLTNLFLLLWESFQISSVKSGYFKELKNFGEIFRLFISFSWAVLELFTINSLWLTGFTALTNAIKGLSGFRSFESTRFYCGLFWFALCKIKIFVLVLAYSVLSFGLVHAAIVNESMSFNNLWNQSLDYALMHSIKEYDNANLEYLIILLAVIVNFVVGINLLISVLGDAYDEFLTLSNDYKYREVTKIILEISHLNFVIKKDDDEKYLHLCVNAHEDKEKKWRGKVIDVREKIEESAGYISRTTNKNTSDNLAMIEKNFAEVFENKIKSMDQSIKLAVQRGVEKVVDAKMQDVEKRIASIEDYIKSMNTQLEKIVSSLST